MSKTYHHSAFRLFVLSAFILLLLLPLSRQGMFIDGVWYAAIAKNMAHQFGSLWDPALSKTMYLHFREHPPLAIYLQSLFFQVLGDGFWVERAYCLTVAILQIGLVSYLWQRFDKSHQHDYSFLLFLWLLIPINIGMYKDNLLEATQTLLTTAGLVTLMCADSQHRWRQIFIYLLGSGLMLAGFLSNGPTSFYLLSIPLLKTLVFKRQSKSEALFDTLLLSLSLALLFLLLFLFVPQALVNVKGYLDVQLMAAISGDRDLSFTGLKHLYIFYIYIKDYFYIALAAWIILSMDALVKRIGLWENFKLAASCRYCRFYFVLSLLASLPVGISHRQMFHYISVSSPVFLLAMVHLTYPSFLRLMIYINRHWRSDKLSLGVMSVLLIGSLGLVLHGFGAYNKNQALIEDVLVVNQYLKGDALVIGSEKVMYDFDLPPHFARVGTVHFLLKKDLAKGNYYIYYAEEALPKGYKTLPLGLTAFKLAKKT